MILTTAHVCGNNAHTHTHTHLTWLQGPAVVVDSGARDVTMTFLGFEASADLAHLCNTTDDVKTTCVMPVLLADVARVHCYRLCC
jgi:hypothetical protein